MTVDDDGDSQTECDGDCDDADPNSTVCATSCAEVLAGNPSATTGDPWFSQSYPQGTWGSPSLAYANDGSGNFAIGQAGTAFKHGIYGPSDSHIVMGCLNYSYNGDVWPEYACDRGGVPPKDPRVAFTADRWAALRLESEVVEGALGEVPELNNWAQG
jgi:hypothetical protein